jgi:hypothetical protein
MASDLLPHDVLQRIVTRLRREEPACIAVLMTGSHTTGSARPDSDVDLTAITEGRPGADYRTWFELRRGLPSLHVSVGASTVTDWLGASEEPADWALGFPARSQAVYVWAVPGAREALGEDPSIDQPAAGPELEDFVEAVAKARRALIAGDGMGMRWHARDAAELAPRLLIPLNPEQVVRDRRQALEAALGLPCVPGHYREDLICCLGLRAEPDAAVGGALTRLAREILAFLRVERPDVDTQAGLAGYLADGTLERHLGLG